MLLHTLLLPLIWPTLVYGSVATDIVHAIENAVSCDACHVLLLSLKVLAKFGESHFASTMTTACEAFGVEDKDVCQGTSQQQAPVLVHDLLSISLLHATNTSIKICDAVFGLCPPPSVIPYTVPFPKPAPVSPKNWTSKGNPPLHVAHFSDAHVDRLYTPGAEADCKKPICCRPYPDYSKVSLPANQTASLHCDSSPALAHAMLSSIPPTNFSIFTGDVEETDVWLCNEQSNINDMNQFAQDLIKTLKSPLYPAIGNHEGAPANLFPRSTSTSNASDAQWVFDTQASNWATWLDANALDQVRHQSGCYAQVVPGTSLRIISLNNIYWYKLNLWLYDSDTPQPDPNGILGFLVEQLQEAEDAGQRAWIMGHMPPGDADALHDQSNYFDQIVQRYKNTIAAQFYGHTHQDQFEVAYSDYSNQSADTAVSVVMIAPSLTPRSGNPAYKYYAIDPDTYEIMDITVYYGDMSTAEFQANPTFKPYYSVRDTWGCLVDWPATEPLNPAFWHKLTEVFEKDDVAFQQYITFLNRGIKVPVCDAKCKASTICGLRAARAENNCVVGLPSLKTKRSQEEMAMMGSAHGQYESCAGTHMGHILMKLTRAARQAQAKGSISLREVIGKHMNEL